MLTQGLSPDIIGEIVDVSEAALGFPEFPRDTWIQPKKAASLDEVLHVVPGPTHTLKNMFLFC